MGVGDETEERQAEGAASLSSVQRTAHDSAVSNSGDGEGFGVVPKSRTEDLPMQLRCHYGSFCGQALLGMGAYDYSA